jgi:hypothetical protein
MQNQKQWFVYVQNTNQGKFWQMSVEPVRWSAEENLQHWLDIHFPDGWEYKNSQYILKGTHVGSHVVGFVSNNNYHVEKLHFEKYLEQLQKECQQYGVYGKEGHDQIISDAKVLLLLMENYGLQFQRLHDWGGVQLTTAQQRAYTALGGSAGHSGNSWSYVCSAAYNLLLGEEPFADGLPGLNKSILHRS